MLFTLNLLVTSNGSLSGYYVFSCWEKNPQTIHAPVCCLQQREQSSSEPSGMEQGERSIKTSVVSYVYVYVVAHHYHFYHCIVFYFILQLKQLVFTPVTSCGVVAKCRQKYLLSWGANCCAAGRTITITISEHSKFRLCIIYEYIKTQHIQMQY